MDEKKQEEFSNAVTELKDICMEAFENYDESDACLFMGMYCMMHYFMHALNHMQFTSTGNTDDAAFEWALAMHYYDTAKLCEKLGDR